MNTIEEIIKSKNNFERYAKEICKECSNRKNKEDLCNIKIKIDGTIKCDNYERCMTTQCNRCKKEKQCFVTAEQSKPIMRGLV